MTSFTTDPHDIDNTVNDFFNEYSKYLHEFDINNDLNIQRHFVVFLDGLSLIRLWGRPLPIHMIWLPKKMLPYYADQDERFIVPKEAIPLLTGHGLFPRQSWAINSFIKHDPMGIVLNNPRFRILEKGTFVFKHFFSYEKRTGLEMGGENAPLWQVITRHSKGRMNKKFVHYSINPLRDAEKLTPEEKEIALRDPRDHCTLQIGYQGPFDLKAIYESEYHASRFDKIAIPILEKLRWTLTR